MLLTPKHRGQLLKDGYVRLPRLISPDLLHRAQRSINASIGKGMNVADMQSYSAQSFCPDIRETPVITNLFNASPLIQAAEEAIGPGRLEPITFGQIALRFPTDLSAGAPTGPWPHIDGMYTPDNGVAEGSIANFTALAGVLLSELPSQNAGNFTVWPGSHVKHADYFRRHGPHSLLEGMPNIDIGPPLQITGRAGDVVLAHYLLGHGVAPNVSPHVRYMCFFRLTAIDHEQTRWEAMCDPWLQWKGIKTVRGMRK